MKIKTLDRKKGGFYGRNKFRPVIMVYADRVIFTPMLLHKLQIDISYTILMAQDEEDPDAWYINFQKSGFGFTLQNYDKAPGCLLYKSIRAKVQEMFPPQGDYSLAKPVKHEGKEWHKLINE